MRSVPLRLLAAAALLYLLYPCAVLECDAVIYACAGLAADPVQSTDAGHLAWGFLEMGAARIGRAMDPPLNPIYLLRWLAILASLGGLWVFHRLAGRLGATPLAAFTLTGLLAFSYSYWHFGIQAESHLVSTFFLLCFASTSVAYFRGGALRDALWAAVFLSLATLLHQTCILFVPAFLVPARLRAGSWRRWLAAVGVFAAAYVVLVIVPYLAVGWFVRDLRSFGEYREWILGLSLWGSWGEWSLRSLPAAAVGAVRSIAGSSASSDAGACVSPALLNRTSSRPRQATVSSIRASICSARVTSAAMNRTRSPNSFTSSAPRS